MQIVIESSSNSKTDLKKRVHSVNFKPKKINYNLTTRRIFQQAVPKFTDHSNRFNSKERNRVKQTKTKNTKNQGLFQTKTDFSKVLLDSIKTVKHEKTKQENLILKYCDKAKLIFWDKDLALVGNQKYVILSADLIIDQDCFWQKKIFDNGSFIPDHFRSNTLGTLNNNCGAIIKNKNCNLNPNISSTSNHPILLIKKHSLHQSTKLNSFIKDWKSLHSKVDLQNRKIIILWIIRKQSTYAQLMEFVNTNQLPLHAVFYIKRKRNNSFFDIGPIVKQIHLRFFQSILYPSKQILNLLTAQSSQISRKTNCQKEKQFFNASLTQILQTGKQLKCSDSSTTAVFHTKLEIFSQQNDQNSSSVLNLQHPKQFQPSTNSKKPLMCILAEQRKIKGLFKKNFPFSTAIKSKPRILKLDDLISKQMQLNKMSEVGITPQIYQQVLKQQKKNKLSMKLLQNQSSGNNTSKILNKDINQSPIKQLNENYINIKQHSTSKSQKQISNQSDQFNLKQSILKNKLQQKPTSQSTIKDKLQTINTKYYQPEIYLLQGIKYNEKDQCNQETYFGKIPLLLNHYGQTFRKIQHQMVSNVINIGQSGNNTIKVGFVKFQNLKDNPLQPVHRFVKSIVKSNLNHSFSLDHRIKNFEGIEDKMTKSHSNIHSSLNISLYQKTLIQKILSSIAQKHGSNKWETNDEQKQQIELTQQQELEILEKTQKKLDQIRKRIIDHIITLKGKNYTFENGESIHYFVGSAFKRNYDLLYNQFYRIYQKDKLDSILQHPTVQKQRQKKRQQKQKTVNHTPEIREIDQVIIQCKDIMQRLAETHFYEVKIS